MKLFFRKKSAFVRGMFERNPYGLYFADWRVAHAYDAGRNFAERICSVVAR